MARKYYFVFYKEHGNEWQAQGFTNARDAHEESDGYRNTDTRVKPIAECEYATADEFMQTRLAELNKVRV